MGDRDGAAEDIDEVREAESVKGKMGPPKEAGDMDEAQDTRMGTWMGERREYRARLKGRLVGCETCMALAHNWVQCMLVE